MSLFRKLVGVFQAAGVALRKRLLGGLPPVFVEDVFSTWLYTGNGSTQTITNGIDLSTKGGMVWYKSRSSATWNHGLFDTTRGVTKQLFSNSTSAEGTYSGVTAFNTNGFSIGSDNGGNESGGTMASWTFRKQPKFFDVVTYTGTGSNRTIAHNLGSAPGFIIIKSTTVNDDWYCYHHSLTASGGMNLNTTGAYGAAGNLWNSTYPTSTVFSLGTNTGVNQSGQSYVAYLFAHNAGGFGLTGTDNVISCGSYTGNGSTPNTVTLGYEPQWIMIKDTTGSTNPWVVVDNMRGMSLTNRVELYPNTSGAELTSATNRLSPTATGFFLNGDNTYYNTSGSTYIYIAIRRGPMKVPTSGTSVFAPLALANSVNTQNVTGFPIDLQIRKARSVVYGNPVYDRLRGISTVPSSTSIVMGPQLFSDTQNAEALSDDAGYLYDNTSWRTGQNWTGSTAYWNFGRAPSFFDEVCYTGNRVSGSTTQTLTHNLGATPELMIVKGRSSAFDWFVYSAALGATKYLSLRSTAGEGTTVNPNAYWNETAPTSTQFTVGANNNINGSGVTFVAYLFATCAGVSKVGSYTGTGTTLQVNCGFTGGARFVLIKRTDSTGDWYVWDSARGIVAGNDPYLLLNSTAAEVTNTDYIDPYSPGFELSSTAPTALNASGGTYIFLAIA